MYKNIFVGSLVQKKSLEFAFEINWPLVIELFQPESEKRILKLSHWNVFLKIVGH